MSSHSRTPVLSFLFVLFVLYSHVLASALPLLKRDVTPPIPSVEDCKAKLNVPSGKAVFYSSAVESSADAYASANSGVTIWTAGLTAFQNELRQQIIEAQNNNQQTWDFDVDGATFFINCSKAFAILASGDVTAVLPAGSDGKPSLPEGSYFTVYEWPILQDSSQNSGVTSVTAYVGNADGSAPSGSGEPLCLS